MSGQVRLQFDVYVTRSVINEETTTAIHGVLIGLSSTANQSPLYRAHVANGPLKHAVLGPSGLAKELLLDLEGRCSSFLG